jgi:hypothetical protein
MLNRASSILLIIAVIAAAASAQDALPSAATAEPAATSPAAGTEGADASPLVLASHPAPVPRTPADSDGSTRSVSPTVAAALASGMPKYNPPTPTPVVNVPQDLRDVDKPRNEIPRLPSYVVHDTRPVVFTQRELSTKEGLVSLSYKLHPGLGFGNLLGLNDAPAYAMYLEEERLAEIADLTDTAHAVGRGGDKGESQYILQQTQDTYIRTPDWSWSGPGGGAK